MLPCTLQAVLELFKVLCKSELELLPSGKQLGSIPYVPTTPDRPCCHSPLQDILYFWAWLAGELLGNESVGERLWPLQM